MSGPVSTLERTGPVPIDPRIRARRIEVRRREGRRRLQRLIEVGLVVLVALGFTVALWTPLLDVDEIQVTGAERTGTAAVLEAAGIERGDQLVSLDLRGAGERVAALPWVQEVRLDQGLDGAVHLAVVERTPVARLTGPDGPVLVDLDGRVLGPATDDPAAAELVELRGLGEPPSPGRYLPERALGALSLAERLAAEVPGELTWLALDELVAGLVQGGEVHFGDAARLDAKVRSLRTMLEQVDLTCLDRIDLSSPGTPVLTREPGCP